jgi:hypothetical protein
MVKKRDGAKDLYAYVSAVRKQGATLLPMAAPRTVKDAKRRKAATKAALKKSSN